MQQHEAINLLLDAPPAPLPGENIFPIQNQAQLTQLGGLSLIVEDDLSNNRTFQLGAIQSSQQQSTSSQQQSSSQQPQPLDRIIDKIQQEQKSNSI